MHDYPLHLHALTGGAQLNDALRHPGFSSAVVSFVEPFSWSQLGCQDISMSDGLKLYAIPNHKNGYKALITAQYAGVSVETPPYEHRVDNKKPEFLKLNPHGKVEPPPVCQVDSLYASWSINRSSRADMFTSPFSTACHA